MLNIFVDRFRDHLSIEIIIITDSFILCHSTIRLVPLSLIDLIRFSYMDSYSFYSDRLISLLSTVSLVQL